MYIVEALNRAFHPDCHDCPGIEMQVDRLPISVYLPPELKERLEAYAESLPKAQGTRGRRDGRPSMSCAIREILQTHLPS